MSLDDRVRNGLRALEDQLPDATSDWGRFNAWAQRRRARRRAFESVAALLLVGALAAGGIAIAARSTPQLPGFIRPVPKGLPACGRDLNVIYEVGGEKIEAVEFGLGGNALTKKSCTIDGKVRLSITSPSGQPLPIQGNGQVQIIRGVVPPSGGRPGVGVDWQWSNWCGAQNQAFYVFVGFDDPALAGSRRTIDAGTDPKISNTPSCVDRAKPSVLRAVPWVPPLDLGIRTGGPLHPLKTRR
jgi:hypothetical protein